MTGLIRALAIFLAIVYVGEAADVDVYTVGLSRRVVDNMEGRYDRIKECARLASSSWTSDHDNSPTLQLEVGDIAGELDKTRKRDRLQDSNTTRVATLGIGEDGEWPVLQFEEGGRSWSLKPSVLSSLATTLNHISLYYGWKHVGVVEDRIEASRANSVYGLLSSLKPSIKFSLIQHLTSHQTLLDYASRMKMDAVVGMSLDGRSILKVDPSLSSRRDDFSTCSMLVFELGRLSAPRSLLIEAVDPITLGCHVGDDWSLLKPSDTQTMKSVSQRSSSPTFPSSCCVPPQCRPTMLSPSASSMVYSSVCCLLGNAIDLLSSRGMEVNGSSIERYMDDVGYFVQAPSPSLMVLKENSLVYSSGRLGFLFNGRRLKEVKCSGAPCPTNDMGHSLAKRAPNQVIYQVPFVFTLSSQIFPASADDVRTLARYAAFRLSNGSGKLPLGVTVNQTIYDDQNQATLAVGAGITIGNENKSVAVIGCLTSSMSLALQYTFATFGTPQLSPTATTPTLSNKTTYPTFTRIVSPANEKAKVIIDIALRFNWTRVYMISSTDEFSSTIARDINDLAIANHILVAENVVVSPGLDQYDSQLLDLASMKPRIVFMMVGPESFVPMIGSMYRVGIHAAATINPGVVLSWNTSTYTAPTNTPDSYLNGWLVIGEPVGIGPQWDSFLNELQQIDNQNAWPNIYKTVTESPELASIVEAYDVVANAISSCLARAPQCDPENHHQLLSSLLNTNTSTLSGNIIFDENGDRPQILEVLNIWNASVKRVARFDETIGLTSFSPTVWPDGTMIPPLAILPPELTWLKWASVPGIIFTVLTAIGILICILTIILVIVYRNSAAIRPATWSMLIVTLVGLTLGFVSSLMWIGRPSKVICHLRFWLTPIAFTLIFSPLVAKTWRIMMIFRKPMAVGGAPRRLKYPLKELIIIVCVLVGIQVVICILWSIIGSGEVVTVPDRDNPDDKAWVTCARSRRNNIFSFVVYGYLGLMLLVGAYFAFRARHAWKLWNESAWIARTIYNALFFSLLAITLGYSLQNFPLVVNILIIVFILEICYVTYSMTFGPKLWMLWRHPDQRNAKPPAPAGPVASAPGSSPMSSGNSHYNQPPAASPSKTTAGRAGAGKSGSGSSTSISRLTLSRSQPPSSSLSSPLPPLPTTSDEIQSGAGRGDRVEASSQAERGSESST